MNLYFNMETNVNEVENIQGMCHLAFQMKCPKMTKTGNQASSKKYKQRQENKISNPMIKTFQYLRRLMWHREVIRNLSQQSQDRVLFSDPSLLHVAGQSNERLSSISGYGIDVKRDSIIRLLTGKGTVCAKCSPLMLSPVFSSTGIIF